MAKESLNLDQVRRAFWHLAKHSAYIYKIYTNL